jgi:hypothetical protein
MCIHSPSKSLGEGTMTLCAMEYLKHANVSFTHFFKISGRYWLSDRFEYSEFDHVHIVACPINGDKNNVSTSLYKLNKENMDDLYHFLIRELDSMKQCIGYEVLFAQFLNTTRHPNNVLFKEVIGVNGRISVSNDFIDT